MFEPAPEIRPWLLPVALASFGVYVLLGALALGELPSARWGLWLVLAAVACFGGAAALAATSLRRRS